VPPSETNSATEATHMAADGRRTLTFMIPPVSRPLTALTTSQPPDRSAGG
jgi:hypothetical protein